ncbi:MAG: hypothetical protein IRY91_00645 [Gemmatimonadaceae bacterium]|nr:hypothetical protein [Gemmatimonadaceae bacterium]
MPHPVPSLRILLDAIVDYAGLFPPAALDMPSAVREYARVRASEDRWALGRFVVPAARLGEMEQAVTALGAGAARGWSLSVLVPLGKWEEIAALPAFNERHAAAHDLAVDTVETRAASPTDVDAAADVTPRGFTTYVEVALDDTMPALLERIAMRGLRAKVRTGGVTPEQFPAPAAVARFLVACAALQLPFKATAGLHHPLRGEYPLTYETGSACGTMFGFLNVFLAAAAARQGAAESEVAALLVEGAPGAFCFDDAGVTWQGRRFSSAELAALRARGAIAFGSCSFREPVTDLRALGLL